jgi:hypothetical protein
LEKSDKINYYSCSQIKSSELYEIYKNYISTEDILTQVKFTLIMKEKGYVLIKKKDARYWIKVSIIN